MGAGNWLFVVVDLMDGVDSAGEQAWSLTVCRERM